MKVVGRMKKLMGKVSTPIQMELGMKVTEKTIYKKDTVLKNGLTAANSKDFTTMVRKMGLDFTIEVMAASM